MIEHGPDSLRKSLGNPDFIFGPVEHRAGHVRIIRVKNERRR